MLRYYYLVFRRRQGPKAMSEISADTSSTADSPPSRHGFHVQIDENPADFYNHKWPPDSIAQKQDKLTRIDNLSCLCYRNINTQVKANIQTGACRGWGMTEDNYHKWK